MLRILCPIDFSKKATYAFEYAIYIANATGSTLVVMSSYHLPRFSGRIHALDGQIKSTLAIDLQYFIGASKDLITTGIEPEIAIEEGKPGVCISSFASQNKIDLIIMGTEGNSDIFHMLTGSVTSKVVEKSAVPVLAVPFGYKEQPFASQLLLCLDVKGINNKNSIDLLRIFKSIPGCKITAFHVSHPGEQIQFAENTGTLAGIIDEIIEIDGDNTIKEIKKYLSKNNFGIVALVGRKHTFWERLLRETHTSAALFSSNIPVLVLPE